jgi:serine phosphatase RsbU (regulator of sigma subunit)
MRLLVYSDGLPDACSAQGERLGQAGVLDAVRSAVAHGPALEPMLDAILDRARAHAGGRPFDDDLSLLAIEL